MMKKSISAKSLTAVFAAIFSIVTLLPIIVVITYALTPAFGVAVARDYDRYTGFEVISTVLSDQAYSTPLWHSVILSLCVAAITTAIGLFLTFDWKHRRRGLPFLIIAMIPALVPGDTYAISYAKLLSYFHLYDMSPVVRLAVAQIAFAMPYCCVILIVVMSSLPASLVRAAEDLGASPFQAFRIVYFPAIKGGILISVLTAFTLVLNESIRGAYLGGVFETLGEKINEDISRIPDSKTFGMSLVCILAGLAVPAACAAFTLTTQKFEKQV